MERVDYTMTWFTMGVDLGSTTAKVVIVDERATICGSQVIQMGAVSRQAVALAMSAALEQAGLQPSDIARTISTGYGRRLVDGADKTFTEITCHARGAAKLAPGVKLVIDIGGQDSKAIAIDEHGFVDRFALNDRCASGTGRFFDVLCRVLEVDLDQVVELALAGTENLEISGMCATFAETEVISVLAQGQAPADISASVHRSVANRTLGLVAQVGKAAPAVMTGGVAKNRALVQFLSVLLGQELVVLDEPQIAGALGAALIARDEYESALLQTIKDIDPERQLVSKHDDRVDCVGCDGTHQHRSNGPVAVMLGTDRMAGTAETSSGH